MPQSNALAHQAQNVAQMNPQAAQAETDQRRIFVLNGPNLNLLGLREPEIYGRDTLADIERICGEEAELGGLDLVFRQSNAEHDLIDWIQDAFRGAAGIVINPAAYSHSSYAIYDALKACSCPIVEVHISNIHGRAEPWRQKSVISAAATGVICGLGTNGYALAVRQIVALARDREKQAIVAT